MDEIDRTIIAQLQADGRTTLQELSKAVGFTSMGTKKRLDRLLSRGTIKVSALINPNVLKLHMAIVMLEMESAEAIHELLNRFEECPRVINIFKTVGGYNLIARAQKHFSYPKTPLSTPRPPSFPLLFS